MHSRQLKAGTGIPRERLSSSEPAKRKYTAALVARPCDLAIE